MNHDESTFLAGCSPFQDFIFFAKSLDELSNDDDVLNSTFFCLDGDELTKYETSVGWPAIAAATIKLDGANRVLVYIAPGGDYWEVDVQTVEETTGRIAEASFALTALAVIEHAILACGMGRMVFRRDGKANWKSVGPTEPLPETGIVGFQDIAGFSAEEIYAVGWQGEIWSGTLDGRWRRVDSPVSANLNAVCCAPDGLAYAVGDGGVMVRGRGDKWEVLDTQRQENLMDVAEFGGTVFVVSDFRILKLRDDRLVPEDAFKMPDRPGTCLQLWKAEDGLISMGPKDLFRLDAGSWSRVV
jgi:hypothetical protein